MELFLYVGRKNPYLREFSARLVAGFFLTNITAETLERNLIRTVLRSMRAKGYNQKHIILVGYSRAAEGYIDRVLANPEWGYRVRGILDDHKPWGYDYRGIKVIGTLKELKPILDMNRLDEIAITLSLKEYGGLEQIVAVCEKVRCAYQIHSGLQQGDPDQALYRGSAGTAGHQHPPCSVEMIR